MYKHFKRALSNLNYNSQNTRWTILILTSAMLLLGLALTVLINTRAISGQWSQVSTVTIYLDDDLSNNEQTKIAGLLKQYPNITDIQVVTPEATMQAFTSLGEDAARLVKGLDPAIFPPALQITVQHQDLNTPSFHNFISQLEAVPGAISVDYGQFEHQQAGAITTLIDIIVTLCSILIILLMVFLSFNTIRVAIYHRQKEIDIQWLVGATMAFIRAPLLFEGFICGSCAGALSAAILALFQYFLGATVNSIISGVLPTFSLTFFYWWLWPVLIICGAMIATIGTLFGVRRIIN